MAFLNKGIRIRWLMKGKKIKEIVFYYEGGIQEFVKYLNKNKDVIHKQIIYFEEKR